MVRYLVALLLALTSAAAQDFPAPSPSHVTVATSVATRIEPGKPVALLADITPKPKIHVYAPGAENYEPVKITLEPRPGITVQQLHYPKSAILDTGFEKVPVYDKPFRLTQDVTVRRGARTVTVKGKLEYQACDDEVCYKPATIPVSWTIKLQP